MKSFKDIEKEAQDLLTKHKFVSVPVDLNALAKALKVKVVEEDLDEALSGALVARGKSSVVLLNRAHHKNRKRFSLAHELAHHVLHFGRRDVFIDRSTIYFRNAASSSGEQAEEVEANRFAAALLMPVESLRGDLASIDGPVTDDDIEDLATKYMVSETAMTFRLANLEEHKFLHS